MSSEVEAASVSELEELQPFDSGPLGASVGAEPWRVLAAAAMKASGAYSIGGRFHHLFDVSALIRMRNSLRCPVKLGWAGGARGAGWGGCSHAPARWKHNGFNAVHAGELPRAAEGTAQTQSCSLFLNMLTFLNTYVARFQSWN